MKTFFLFQSTSLKCIDHRNFLKHANLYFFIKNRVGFIFFMIYFNSLFFKYDEKALKEKKVFS